MSPYRSARLTTLALVLVLVIGLGGCGSGPPEPPAPETVTAADLHEMVRTSEAEVVIVNIWATWCAPCREEFPEYIEFAREYRDEGARLWFVSVDDEEQMPAVEEFLQEQGVAWQTYLKEGPASRFIPAMHGDWSGALPATFIFRSDGSLVTYWEGTGTYERLENQAVPLLSS